MPPRKRASSVLNGDARDEPTASPKDLMDTPGPDDALALAEQAEAEAEAAEAAATAARARAHAMKLRRQAEKAATAQAQKAAALEDAAPTVSAPVDEPAPVIGPDAETEAAELDQAPADAEHLDAQHLDDADLDEPADHEIEEPARRRRLRLKVPRIRLRWVAAALVVLCTLGFLGAGGYMIWHHRQVTAEQQRSAQFAAAARQGVVTLMSLNFNTASDDVKRIIDNTTGDFRKDFQGQADEFTKVAQSSKVITEATVNATAVQSMTNDSATVLVAVTTQVSNAASKEQQPRSWRLLVDMARDGGQLKMAKVEFVP